MTDYEISGFIRDKMLEDPTVDSDFVWKLYRRSEIDSGAYVLMSKWMETTSDFTKNVIKRTMERYLELV